MHVNPFWLGVLVTLVVEIVGILIAAGTASNKEHKNDRD